MSLYYWYGLFVTNTVGDKMTWYVWVGFIIAIMGVGYGVAWLIYLVSGGGVDPDNKPPWRPW